MLDKFEQYAEQLAVWGLGGLLALVTTLSGLILNLVVRVFKLDRAAIESRLNQVEKHAQEGMGRLEKMLVDRLTAQDHSLTRLHDRMDALQAVGRTDRDERRVERDERRAERDERDEWRVKHADD